MKVIFLDIDGVLNVIPQGHDKYGGTFHPHFEDNLRKIVDETGADIVISSTWRMSGRSVMQDMWKDRKLAGKVIGCTPSSMVMPAMGDYTRGDEIQHWLDHNEVESYVILDDDTDMLDSQMLNFVKTSDNHSHPDYIDIGYGLTDICTTKAINILNNKR